MDQIDQVRQKVDLVELISSYIPLKKAGRNFKALCPFHSEKTPSFVVSPERQIWKCFGCGLGGDAFKFLMEYEGMDFGEALRFLADKTGIKLKSYQPSKAYQEKERLISINHLASEFYHYILLNHPVGQKARGYLLKRGVRESSVKLFKLGYAPESWESLQRFLINKKGYKKEDLEKVGLIIRRQGRSSFYDRFRSRIIFPLFDHRGNILGFSGRTLSKDSQGAKYINTPETPLYHKSNLFYGLNWTREHIKEKDQAVIVEGELDFISSYQAGVKNVIAIKGTALTENQAKLIQRFTNNIALALDKDLAGDKAVKRGIELADSQGLNIRIIQLKYGKDPDECVQRSAKAWRQSVKETIPIYDFYLQSAVDRFGVKGGEAKKKVSEEIIPILAGISNQVVKAHYLKKLAQVLQVDEEAVVKEIERWQRLKKLNQPQRLSEKKLSPPEEEKTRRERLEELLLAYILQQKKGRKKWLAKIDLKQIGSNPVRRILKALQNFLEKKKLDINQLVKDLPAELVETLDRLYLKDLEAVVSDNKVFSLEFEKTQKELEKISLREELKALTEEIREKEQTKKEDEVLELREKFRKISQKLKDLS